MNFLTLFVIIPILAMFAILMTKNPDTVRKISLTAGSLLMILAGVLTFLFLQERAAGNTELMLFRADVVWYQQLNIHHAVGVDGISVIMLTLSSIVVFTGVLSSWKIESQTKDFFMWFFLLSIGVFGFFISIDIFTMFMYYEVALIPMYLLVGVWGTGRKHYAAMKLTLMLMGASTLLLISIIGIYYFAGATTMNIVELANIGIPEKAQKIFFPLTFIGFGTLAAMFPFHTWSPDGYAAAPTSVSMLHAGVLKKLGCYGAFRIAVYLMPAGAAFWAPYLMVITGFGVVYGAYMALKQTDLKFINAYSSVSHCGLVLFAILMLNETALTGAIMQMLAHGLMTALTFSSIGMIYSRTHTRNVLEMGGLMKIMPMIGIAYMIAGMASFGLPGLSGFVAEMPIFIGAFEHSDLLHRLMTIFVSSSLVITAVYILRVVGKVFFGPVHNQEHLKLTDALWHEKITIVTLIFSIVAIGTAPFWISDLVHNSLAPIIGHILLQ